MNGYVLPHVTSALINHLAFGTFVVASTVDLKAILWYFSSPTLSLGMDGLQRLGRS